MPETTANRVNSDVVRATPGRPFEPTGSCDSHGKGRYVPDSIAVLTRVRGSETRRGEVHERCYDHVRSVTAC